MTVMLTHSASQVYTHHQSWLSCLAVCHTDIYQEGKEMINTFASLLSAHESGDQSFTCDMKICVVGSHSAACSFRAVLDVSCRCLLYLRQMVGETFNDR